MAKSQRGTKLQRDAKRRSALLLSLQRVKPHFVAESLITTTVKNAPDTTTSISCHANSSSTQRPAGACTDRRGGGGGEAACKSSPNAHKFGSLLQPCTHQSHTCHLWQHSCTSRSTTAAICNVCESQHHPGPHLACTTSHRQRVW